MNLHGINLGPKLGPLPVGAWAVVAAGGLWLGQRRKQQANDAATVDDTGGQLDAGVDTGGGLEETGTPVEFDDGGDGGAVAAGYADNQAWAAAAVTACISAGVAPTVAHSATVKFLSGDPLNVAEMHAVNVAIGAIGEPPDGAPPIRSSAPPVKKPPVKTPPVVRKAPVKKKPPVKKPAPRTPPRKSQPAKKRSYTVKSGDTLGGIASKEKVPGGAAALYKANAGALETAAHKHGRKSSDNGHWIYAGTVLHW
jgi:nucleoid-associated protein YgaU